MNAEILAPKESAHGHGKCFCGLCCPIWPGALASTVDEEDGAQQRHNDYVKKAVKALEALAAAQNN